MDAILISLFILSCYTVLKIGLRVYHIWHYLRQRRYRKVKTGQAGALLRADFGGHRYRVVPAKAG